jgi:hypothetical protein
MDYEELYQSMQPLEKKAGDKLAAAQRNFRNLRKNSEAGDLKSFAKDMQLLEENIAEQTALLAELKSKAEAFDTKEYMEGGDFARQVEYELKRLEVDVKGDFPAYEIFPYKVRVDIDNQDIYVDRKKVQCVRPSGFARKIKADRDRLFRGGFNANDFINELCAVYDFAIAIKNKNKVNAPEDAAIYLRDLYDFLAPMRRFRKDYDMQAFAFDLSRLLTSDVRVAKDNRRLDFGTSRMTKKMIRVLDAKGNETFLTTVRFFTVTEDESEGDIN